MRKFSRGSNGGCGSPEGFVRNVEHCLCALDVFGEKRIAVRFMTVCEVRRWKTDMCLQNAQGRRAAMLFRLVERKFKSVHVFANFT